MSVYKVPQDVEADDKFLGPLSFRQFIFAGIVVIAGYLSFVMLTKGFPFGIIFTFPVMLLFGFLAFPFGREQPNEVWLAAQIRFFIKPRLRIWNQDGIKELVHVIVPKREVHLYTDGLSQVEVKSRLSALASMMDTRGWAVKNVSTNNFVSAKYGARTADDTDRLIDTTTLPIEVPEIPESDATDMLDETTSVVAHQFDTMIQKSEESHRGAIMDKLQHAREHPKETADEQGIPTSQDDFWFAHETNAQPSGPGHATVLTTGTPAQVIAPNDPVGQAQQPPATTQRDDSPISEDEFLEKVHKEKERQKEQLHAISTHLRTVNADGTVSGKNDSQQPEQNVQEQQKTAVTPTSDPDILQLATNNDLNVATIARQADKAKERNLPPDEVVISLR